MSKVYYPKAIAHLEVLLYDSEQTFTVTLQPIRVHINKKTYTMADDFSMTVRFEDLPFDPRLAKNILVNISVVDVKSLDSIKTDALSPEHIMFRGFADVHQINLETTERTVSFEGRDFTALFIDSPFDNANLPGTEGKRTKEIQLNRPVYNIIQDLMSNLPAVRRMKIRDETNGKALKNFSASVPNYDLVQGKKTTSGQYAHINPNRNYWDAIVSICESAGMIVYVDLDELVLTTPRILYQGPTTNSKRTLQFVYGNNLSKLDFHRELGKKKKFNIVIRTFDVITEKSIVITIPRDATASWAREMDIPKKIIKVQELDTNGQRIEKDAPFITIYEPDLKTREQLIERGQTIFEEYVRQEIEGSCETYNMAVKDDRGVEFDLTQIKTGTPIKIEMLIDDVQNLLRFSPTGQKITDQQRREEMKKKITYLQRRGYSTNVANILINAISRETGKLRPTFYAKEVNVNMDTSGFSLRIGFVNFIQV